MGIKQSTLADAAPNPHAAHARLHCALEQVWPSVDMVIALAHVASRASTVAALIQLLTLSSTSTSTSTSTIPLPLPLPDPVAAHLAAMLASYALIDLQILHLKQISSQLPPTPSSTNPPASSGSGNTPISIASKTPTLALRLAINARPLSSISGKATRSPKTRRHQQQHRGSNSTARPSSAPTANSGPSSSMSPNPSFLDSPISYTTFISALSHLILAIDVPGLPLHTPDLPLARLPTAALSAPHTRRTSAGGANSRYSQTPSHASPRSTKSSKSPLILSWLAPHVHYAHVVQLALATLCPSCLLPPDPVPLVAQSCTVDELAQILAFAINLWAATACSSAPAPPEPAAAPGGAADSDHLSSHFLSPASPSQPLHPNSHHISPTATFSPSPSTRSIYHPPSHRISGATINSSILSRPPPHHPHSHAHRPGSLFSTLSTVSTNDPIGVNPGNASVYTDHGSTLPDLETRTLRGQWDGGGGGRAASLMPVRSMTLSFQGASDDEEEEEDDDDNEDHQGDDGESVASSVEPHEALSSSSASASPAAGPSPTSPTPPPQPPQPPHVAASSSPPPHTPPTTSRPSTTAAAGGGTSPVLAPLAPATLSVASTHTRRHRAGSMTSTTAVFHLRMGDLEDSGAGHGLSASATNATGDRAAAAATATATATADRWSIRSHYPAPSILSAQTSAVGSSMYHYQSPHAPQRTSYGGGGGGARSASFGVPSSPTTNVTGAHVHYPPTAAAAAPSPVVIPPSRLRPLAHRLMDLAASSTSSALDWDAMVRLVLYPLIPYLWSWSLSSYLGMRMLDTSPPPRPALSAPGMFGSHILPTHAPPAAPPSASHAPTPAGSLLFTSLIAHWLVQSSLVPPAPDAAPTPAPTLTPVTGHVVFRATANGWTDAALNTALAPHAEQAAVALVALAVPFAGSTDVEPVVLAVDIRGKGGVVVVSPTRVVQRVHVHAASAGVVAAGVGVGGVVSVELEQQRAHVWIGGGGLNLPVDVGAVGGGSATGAGMGAGAPAGAVCVVLPVLDVELVVYA